jgi:hypothetical protein
MTKSRTQLKIASIIVLIFTALSLFNIVAGLVFGELPEAEMPEGAPENLLLITQIFVLVITAIMLIPQVYVGVKGIKVANKPTSSKAHIIWAIILLAFAAGALATPISAIVTMEYVVSNVFSIISIAAEIVVFLIYIKSATAVSRGK